VLGTTRLWQETGEHPRALADQVCSPGGTTIEGVCALQEHGFEDAVISAVRASYEKDSKL
jgi:pyrroline-5-carboxylate reductase